MSKSMKSTENGQVVCVIIETSSTSPSSRGNPSGSHVTEVLIQIQRNKRMNKDGTYYTHQKHEKGSSPIY